MKNKKDYIEKNLISMEEIIYRTKLHWIIFLPCFLIGFCSILAIAQSIITHNPSGWFAFPILLIIGTIGYIATNIKSKTWKFAVTNKRVLIKTGWLRIYSLELVLTKVEGVAVNQSILGRILDYGTIVITGTGGTREPFKNIAKPFEFRKKVQEQIGQR